MSKRWFVGYMSILAWLFSLSLMACQAMPAGQNPATGTAETGSEAANKAVVQRFYDEVFTQKKMPVLDEIFGPKLAIHDLDVGGELPGGGLVETLAAFPDVKATVNLWVIEGELVTAYVTLTGTHQAEFLGVAPTNKTVTWSIIDLWRVKDGKITELWHNIPNEDILEQITVPPTAAASQPAGEKFIAGSVFRGNLERSGVYETSGPTQGKLKWKFAVKVSDSPTSTAIGNGLIYIQALDEYLHAVDIQTGQEKWNLKTGYPSVFAPPAVVSGTVYVGSQDHNLYAVDAQTGQEKWKFTTGGWVESSPAVANGVVYFGADDHYLYAVDSQTGQEKWRFETGDQVWSSPALAAGVVYVASQDHYLYAVDAQTGQEKWKFETGGPTGSFPAIAGELIYITSTTGPTGVGKNYLYALDRQTGQEKWRFDPAAMPSDPSVAAGLLYIGNADGQLYALDATTGQEKWQFKAKGAVESPAIAGDVLYISSNDGNLYAVDTQTGQEKWRFKTAPFSGMGWPVIVDGVAYVTSTDGHLYAIQ